MMVYSQYLTVYRYVYITLLPLLHDSVRKSSQFRPDSASVPDIIGCIGRSQSLSSFLLAIKKMHD